MVKVMGMVTAVAIIGDRILRIGWCRIAIKTVINESGHSTDQDIITEHGAGVKAYVDGGQCPARVMGVFGGA